MEVNTILRGDALEILRTLPDEAVHCVVTSPPYWGLRDYGCAGQLGQEPTPQEYLERMVDVFREIRRALRKDGTAWVNMGDTWKDKRALGLPWRLALALQADGWWLRSEIIWHKPNPMPSSVKDRPTVAHETIFLLTKSQRYFYDYEGTREPSAAPADHPRNRWDTKDHLVPGQKPQKRTARRPPVAGFAREGKHEAMNWNVSTKRRTVQPCDTRGGGQGSGEMTYPTYSRALRSVWTIATHPFPEAHFATFPPRLAETCIKAGCPAGGVVLDPFSGAGTTCMVAAKLGRTYLGIELNPEYAAMAERRISQSAGLLLAAGDG